MILDTLDAIDRYSPLNPRFGAAFAFLRRLGADPTIGRHEIDGDSAYALVQHYQTRSAAGASLEAHQRYIDIQYVARGHEAIHWASLAGLTVTMPHDAAKDVALFSLPPDAVPVPIRAGQCAILFPDDAHAPCCIWGEPTEVVKVVLKVAVAE
jgi:YhcH/YjgK/YiaL family protein